MKYNRNYETTARDLSSRETRRTKGMQGDYSPADDIEDLPCTARHGRVRRQARQKNFRHDDE